MRKKKNFALKLFVILLILLTTKNLSAEPMNAGQSYLGHLEKTLEPNDRAPFRGVLVPLPQYRYYQEQVEMNFRNSIDPDECDETSPWWAFLVGVVGGVIVSGALTH